MEARRSLPIPVERLTSTPTPFEFQVDGGWWRSALGARAGWPDEPEEPCRIEGSAHRMGEDLYLEGTVTGRLELECGRCLARYRHRLREPFRLVLEPAGERAPADPEEAEAFARDGMFLGEELEVGWFRGSVIYLGAFVREIIALALPVAPLCSEECAGLCPRCGADRNRGSCECPGPRGDSPFAALASLRPAAPGQRAPGHRERKGN